MTRILIASLTLAALLAGCGESGESDRSSVDSGTGSPPADPGAAAQCLPAAVSQAGGKPAVDVPDGDPPSELRVEDLTAGTAEEAAPGSCVTVHYVGVAWSTKKQFDASWDSGRPLAFRLGQGQVIPGWDRGIAGMKVGGRRQLEIPPDLAYGPGGYPPVIGPNETLVFVVDLLAVRP